MNDKTGRLLVVESDDALREQIVAVLRGAGYEVSTDYREGMKAVFAFDPDAVVLGADPPQLDCCGLLSEIKSSERIPGLCCDHSIADWRADRTTIDGTLASGPGRRGTWSIPGERSTKATTSEEEPRPEIANCSQQARKRFGFTKSINRSRKPPSEARDRRQGCADDYPVL